MSMTDTLEREDSTTSTSLKDTFINRTGRFAAPLLLVAAMWVIQLFNIHGWMNNSLGLRSRTMDSLLNIFTFPFVHAGWWHLAANSVPLLVLGCIIAMGGTKVYLQTTALIITIGGGLLWLFGPSHTITVGASGLVFGYITYLVARAIFYPASFKKIGYIAGALIIAAFYSATFVSGVIPHIGSGISWQAHVFGAIAGVITAWLVGSFSKTGEDSSE